MNETSDYKTLGTENTINVGGNNANESKATQSDNTWSVARLKKSISMPEYWNCPSVSIYDIIDEPITILGAVPKNTIHGENRRLIHIQRQDGTEVKVFTNSIRVKELVDSMIENNVFPFKCKIVKYKNKNKEFLDLED